MGRVQTQNGRGCVGPQTAFNEGTGWLCVKEGVWDRRSLQVCVLYLQQGYIGSLSAFVRDGAIRVEVL